MRTELRGIWMAGKLAEEQKYKVGWAYLPNNKNVVALKKSGGSESLYSEKTAITPLTTVPYGAVTRMNSAFAGGGAQTLSPARLSATLPQNSHYNTSRKLVHKSIVLLKPT